MPFIRLTGPYHVEHVLTVQKTLQDFILLTTFEVKTAADRKITLLMDLQRAMTIYTIDET